MEVLYFNETVKSFISRLPNIEKVRIVRLISILSEYGFELKMPYSKSLGNKLFELRYLGKTNIRAIYIFFENKIIILHIFYKKTNKISLKDLNLSIERKKQLYKR